MQILFEDNHLIAINKPHGQLVQADHGGDLSLLDEVKAFIKARDQKLGNVFIGLLHRLDRPVGGVVLFAKTSKAASRISDQFRRHSVQKIYWAVVEVGDGARALTHGEVVQWLVKDESTNVVTAFDHEVAKSQKAELSYQILEARGDHALMEISPKTGRSHQIRVAMSSLGCPIVGDLKYGSKQPLQHDIALFARSLSFDHPITGERMAVAAEPSLKIFSK
ncbi:MAG: RluA family pseudouridine synthase [Patescibacteria group bacterium]